MRRSWADWGGFTLVESLLACAFVASAMLGAAQLVSLALAMNDRARHVTVSSTIAAQKIEELRAAGAPVSGADVLDRAGRPARGIDGGVMAYRRRWTVTPVGGDLTVLVVAVAPISGEEPGTREIPADAEVRLATVRVGAEP